MIHRYDLWENTVDNLLIIRTGLDMNSFEDFNWRGLYDEGLLPTEAIDVWLEQQGVPGLTQVNPN